MIYVTYKDLVMRFGDTAARKLLRAVERHAATQNAVVIPLDPEERFRRALEALNEINLAA